MPHGELLVISPHLDDAIFSCAELVASYQQSAIVTVFAGRAKSSLILTQWDHSSGFIEGDDVIGIRRLEDQAALEIVNAHAVWLSYCDSQYQQQYTKVEIAHTLRSIVRTFHPTIVLFPLGLFHSDHVLTSDACLQLIEDLSECDWIAYEEALYRRIDNLIALRFRCLKMIGLSLQRANVIYRRNISLKSAAVHCYRSQLRALSTVGPLGYTDVFADERYWLVTKQC